MMKILLTILVFSYVTVLHSQDWRPYKVTQGDQLGFILHEQGFKLKIWGKNGLLKEALKRNPHVKNPDKITPGLLVLLPSSLPIDEPVHVSEPAIVPEPLPAHLVEPNSEPPSKDAAFLPITFNLGTHFSFWDRDLTDKKSGAKANLQSNLISGILIGPKVELNEMWIFEGLLSIKRITFASAGRINLSDHSKIFVGAESGLLSRGKKFQYGLGVSWDELPYVNSYDSRGVNLETNRIFAGYLKGQWRIRPSAVVGLRFKHLVGAIEGNSVGPYFNYDHKLSNGLSLLFNPFMNFENSESKEIRYEDREIGIRVGIQGNF
jgi:hypothetical protein